MNNTNIQNEQDNIQRNLSLERLEEIEKNNYLGIDLCKYGLVYKYDSEFEMLKLDEPANNLHIVCNQNSKMNNHFQKYFEYFGFKNLKINISSRDDEYEGNPEGEVIVDIIKIKYKNFTQEYEFSYCYNDMEGDNLLYIFNTFMYDYINSCGQNNNGNA